MVSPPMKLCHSTSVIHQLYLGSSGGSRVSGKFVESGRRPQEDWMWGGMCPLPEKKTEILFLKLCILVYS